MSVSIRFPRVLFALAALGLPVCATADTISTPVRTFVQAFVGDAGQSAVSATAVPARCTSRRPAIRKRPSGVTTRACRVRPFAYRRDNG